MLEKDILAKTYLDTCKVYRKQPTEDSNGITSQSYTLLSSNNKCALSNKTRSFNTTQKDAENAIDYTNVLFCLPDIDINAGDLIEVTISASNKTKKFYSADPFIYPSHAEVPIKLIERA